MLPSNRTSASDWYHRWVGEGFNAIEKLLTKSKFRGSFCYGEQPTIADVFLVPQVYNAERFKCFIEPYPNIRKIYEVCMSHSAFVAAQPHMQPDASEYDSEDEYDIMSG